MEPYAIRANKFFHNLGFKHAFQKCVLIFVHRHNNNSRKFKGWCGNFIQMSFELGKPTSVTYAFDIAFYKNGQLEE